MDYEEKLEEAKRLYQTVNADQKYVLERLFPELKESEDERIKKAIIDIIKSQKEQQCHIDSTIYDEMIAWLEKQGEKKVSYTTLVEIGNGGINALVTKELPTNGCNEQKPFDYENATIVQKDFAPKTEPKFHKGEWLCENEPNNYARFIQILETVNVQGKERYRISRDIHNDEDIVEFDFVEKYYHKFDIQDAKDGDVLVEDSCIFIIQKLGDNNTTAKTYCTLYNDGDFDDGSILYFDIDSTKPATKEQRDTLMKAMADAGWEFDFEKKELKKIEQKPAWSEEDERICHAIICDIANDKAICKYELSKGICDEQINWLKSIKERIGG